MQIDRVGGMLAPLRDTAMSPLPSPGRLPVRYLLSLFDELELQGLDASVLQYESGVDLAEAAGEDHAIDAQRLAVLAETAARLTGRTDLAFDIGLHLKPNAHGLLGFALMSCRDLDQVFQLLGRYLHLITDIVTLRYQRNGAGRDAVVTVTPVVALEPPLLRAATEAAATALHQHIRLLNAPRLAYTLTLAMAPPPHAQRYADLAPAQVEFAEGRLPGVTAELPAALVDAPLPMAAPRVVAELEGRLQVQMRRLPPGTRWTDYIQSMLREAQGQPPSVDELAGRLGVSARTIDRHLAAEGVSYRDLTRAMRLERARELLARPGATVAQVAEQLGFGDPASFSRAFRRGSGMPPGEYQRWLRNGQKP